MKKRIWALLLIVMTVVNTFPLSAIAVDPAECLHPYDHTVTINVSKRICSDGCTSGLGTGSIVFCGDCGAKQYVQGWSGNPYTPPVGNAVYDVENSTFTLSCSECHATKTYDVTVSGGVGTLTEKEEPECEHSYIVDETRSTAATCVDAGKTVKVCSLCGDEIEEVVPAKGHRMGLPVITPASCVTDGRKITHCLDCDYYEEETVHAEGHVYADEVTEPTCTEKGYTTHKCTKCDHSYVDTYVDVHGHSYVVDHTVPATCIALGTIYYKCEYCDDFTTESIDYADHVFEYVEDVEPTCCERGYELWKCRVCGETEKRNYFGTTTAHIPDATYTPQVVDPGCETSGYTRYHCEVCGEYYQDDFTAPIGHKWIVIESVEPNCSTEGYTISECEHCKERSTVNYDKDKDKHAHYTQNIIKDATCTEDGRIEYVCDDCGIKFYEDVPTTGHTPGEGVILDGDEPTCTEDGVITYYCTECHKVAYTDVAPAAGHVWDEGTIITEATCNDQGLKAYTCRICDEKRYENIPRLTHVWKTTITKEPSCTETGLEVTECELCQITMHSSRTTLRRMAMSS